MWRRSNRPIAALPLESGESGTDSRPPATGRRAQPSASLNRYQANASRWPRRRKAASGRGGRGFSRTGTTAFAPPMRSAMRRPAWQAALQSIQLGGTGTRVALSFTIPDEVFELLVPSQAPPSD